MSADTYVVGLRIPLNRERWAEAAPKMAMAFCEAGYPCRHEPFSFVSYRENELRFTGPMPPDAVILRAGELCGVADLLDGLIREGYHEERSPSEGLDAFVLGHQAMGHAARMPGPEHVWICPCLGDAWERVAPSEGAETPSLTPPEGL